MDLRFRRDGACRGRSRATATNTLSEASGAMNVGQPSNPGPTWSFGTYRRVFSTPWNVGVRANSTIRTTTPTPIAAAGSCRHGGRSAHGCAR
jgi:hypothetical protein